MKFISVGRIAGTYGLLGEVKVKPQTEHPELFAEMEYLLLTQKNELKRSLKIEDMKPHGEFILVKLTGIDSEPQAKALKGFSVGITEDMLPQAEEGELYWYEIDGAKVITEDGKDIGVLVDYMETGSTDIFRIALHDKRFALISNNKDHVVEINTEDKTIIISELGLVYEDL